MRISFEPGYGSFEVILEKGERLPAHMNVLGHTVFVALSNGSYECVKGNSDLLKQGNPYLGILEAKL